MPPFVALPRGPSRTAVGCTSSRQCHRWCRSPSVPEKWLRSIRQCTHAQTRDVVGEKHPRKHRRQRRRCGRKYRLRICPLGERGTNAHNAHDHQSKCAHRAERQYTQDPTAHRHFQNQRAKLCLVQKYSSKDIATGGVSQEKGKCHRLQLSSVGH
jgi:hypothetical protein